MRGFREIREIKDNFETRQKENEKEEGFKKIKPETDITIEEANNFWNTVFARGSLH